MTDQLDVVAHAKQLNAQRLNAWNEGRALLDEVNTRGGEWSAEDTAKWNAINADIDRLDEERNVYVTAEQREREAAEIRESEYREFGEQRVQRRDIEERQRVLAALRDIGQSPAGSGKSFGIDVSPAYHERELMRSGMDASEARAIAWDTGSIASGVPVTTARSLYQYMEASMAMFRLPTTKISTASGEQMKFPRLAAHAIATQVIAQGTAIGGTDPTFAAMVLDAFKYGELAVVANEVITDTGFDFTQFLLRDLGRAVGRVVDADLVVGTGTNEPNGVVTAAASAGSITTGGSLINPSVENLIDLVHTVVDEYRNSGSAAWLMKDATAGVIRKLRDGAGGTVGALLWEPSLTSGLQNGVPDRLLGYPVFTDVNLAALASNSRSILFGDFSAYYIRTVGDVRVERDDSRYFDTDQVGFRAKWRVDGDLIDTNAIASILRNV